MAFTTDPTAVVVDQENLIQGVAKHFLQKVFGLERVPPRLLLKYPLRNKVSGPGRGLVRTGRTV